jgi:UDP-glucuronate 4-epimerase
VFNRGEMRRDFTYVDDIVQGVLGALDHPPPPRAGEPPHAIYNLGNNQSEDLTRFIQVIETALGRKAVIELKEMQPGDVKETFADIAPARRDFGFEPKTSIDVGIPRFVEWYREYHKL